MRFFIIFTLLSSVFFPHVYANNIDINHHQPAITSPLASKSLLLDIAKLTDNTLVAVGHHGHVVLSSDGEQWEQAAVPVQTTLTSVFFINEDLGWAVGHDAIILHTKNGGENWSVQQFLPELEKPLLDVHFKNPKQGIAIGAYGMFYRTNDGGETWKSEFHQEFLLEDDIEYLNELKSEDNEAYLDEIAFILPHFNRIERHNKSLFLVGEIGLVAKSDDFGETWLAYENFYQGSFFGFASIKESTVLVAGLRGHVFKSDDVLPALMPINAEQKQALEVSVVTQEWDEKLTNTTALLNDIVVTDTGTILILGNNGTLLVSHDNAVSFEKHIQPDGKPLIAGVWFEDKLIVVSDIGVRTIDINAIN